MQSVDTYLGKGAQSIISRTTNRYGDSKQSLTNLLDEEAVSQAWSAFGLYLSRQMRMGRGVLVKNFGTFTFSAPEVTLDGVTNPIQRDKQPRLPVFLVAKEYVKGKTLRAAIAQGRQLRPYQCQTSGSIQQTMINYAEIAVYASQNKDSCKIALDRVLKTISDMARNKESVDVDIPGVGTLIIKSDLAAVSFQESLTVQCRGIAKRPLSERKQQGDMKLTQNYLQALMNEPRRQTNNLGLEIDAMSQSEDVRPKTAKVPSAIVLKRQQFNQRSTTNIDRPQTSHGFNYTKAPQTDISDQKYAVERLRCYIRDRQLNIEDAFIDICKQGLGRNFDKNPKLTQADFTNSLRKIGLPLNDLQTILLFEVLDKNKDGKIDKNDWLLSLQNEKNNIHYIKDVIYRYRLYPDDILQRMRLTRDSPPLNYVKLRDSLLLLDVSLNNLRAVRLAREILADKDSISVADLLNLFDTQEEEDKEYDPSWFKDTLYKLKNRLSEQQAKQLRDKFEYFDENQEGLLDEANFKTVIIECSIGLSFQDINRIARYLPKFRENLIDYYAFLKMIESVEARADLDNTAKDLIDFARKLNSHLKYRRITPAQAIQSLRKGQVAALNSLDLAQYLQKNFFSGLTIDQCQRFCDEMDIDLDGVINEDDMKTFLKRFAYFDGRRTQNKVGTVMRSILKNGNNDDDAFSNFEKSVVNSKSVDALTIGQKRMFETVVNGVKDSTLKPISPQEPLQEEKFDQILKNLRIKLQAKGMTSIDLFNLLDSDQNGFITITEFSENLDKIIHLSQPAKDGFFAFMDKKQIGLVDRETFVKCLSKSVVQKMAEHEEDNFDWEIEILFKIRNWVKRENLSVEDAFRTMDRDFDGEISKKDIKLFITEIFKTDEKILTDAKINRVFKLMDQFKRGKITLMDFKRFIQEGVFYGNNKTVFGDPETKSQSAVVQAEIRSSFDWKANARQQIGLSISRKFSSVKESYDIISGYGKKLVFSKFKKWIDDSNSLQGFDLTLKLLQELFSDIDSHNKGYLTDQDWLNAFDQFNWLDQMIQEVNEACKNFHSNEDLITYFRGQENHSISKESFYHALQSLFPRRFKAADVTALWNRVSPDSNFLSPQQFLKIFGDMSGSYVEVESAPEANNSSNINLMDKIRRYLRISKLSLPDLFRHYDPQLSGKVTNMEFRQIMRSLSMGLTKSEIDQLCSICLTDASTLFDWKEFAKMISLRQADLKIVDRASIHLIKINDHIYNYLIAPKDAFRQYDRERQGFLTFSRFQELIETLFRLAREDVPPYAIIKDLFEFIDKRRDDQIDLAEWMDTFSLYPNPNIQNQQRRPYTSGGRRLQKKRAQASLNDKHLSGGKMDISLVKDFEGIGDDGLMNASTKFQTFLRKPMHREVLNFQDNGTWESSKQFDRIITTIGKNRKYLWDIFKQLSQNGMIELNVQQIKFEMEKMLRSQGIHITEEQWPSLLAWAIKNGHIDYKFLLSVYKDRLAGMDTQPRVDIK